MDNVGYTPGSGVDVAADDVDGVLYQRIKPAIGEDGIAVDVSSKNPMPVVSYRSDDLLVMLSRIVKLLESNAVVDSAQRQRVNVDAGTLSAVTTVGTVTTVTTVSNLVANAGMDREQYINVSKNTYANSIRRNLVFT
jgi:NADPH:quinone reductase-like Zn-dependent oxidoreductase